MYYLRYRQFVSQPGFKSPPSTYPMEHSHFGNAEPTSFHHTGTSSTFPQLIWNDFNGVIEPVLSISPDLLYQHSDETLSEFSYHEQATNTEETCNFVKEGSIPVDELMDEILWPQQELEHHQSGEYSPLCQTTQQVLCKDTRIDKEALHSSDGGSSDTLLPVINVEIGKRRRGRPRLYHSTDDEHNAGVPSKNRSSLRQQNLEKNRVAAEKCRLRRKESTARLLVDFELLSKKNESLKTDTSNLRQQLIDLKNEVLSHAGCASSIIDGYIAKSAGSQIIAKSESYSKPPRRDSVQTHAYADSARDMRNLSPGSGTTEIASIHEGSDSEINTNACEPFWRSSSTNYSVEQHV